jgi:DNA-binding MarR family transcriptional regulator
MLHGSVVQQLNIVANNHQPGRDLEILTAIGERQPLTQRALAERVGVALGLTNLYLKRLAKKGYVKIADFRHKPAAGKRLRYILTARGIAEKSRLTYEHAAYALRLYARARQTLRESLSQVSQRGLKRIALYGTGEAAELAYLTLKESGLEPVGVFDARADGQFLGMPVQSVADLDDESFDAIVIATFDPPDTQVAALERRGIPRAKILTLRRLTPNRNGDRG